MANDMGLINREMEMFCKLFAQWAYEETGEQSEMLFHSLLRGSKKKIGNEQGIVLANEEWNTWELATVRQRNKFKRQCQILVRQHNYFALLEFAHGLLVHNNQYDLEIIYDLLSGIFVREDYSLVQLCVDYAREVQGEYGCYAEPIPEDADLFRDFPEGFRLQQGSGHLACRALVRTLMKYVYQLDYADETLTQDHIDAIVAQVRQQAVDADQRKRQYVDQNNERLNAKKNRPYATRLVHLELSDYKRDQAIPGLLLPFVMWADLEREETLCYYMLEQYVLPILVGVPWGRMEKDTAPVMTQLIRYYADYFQDLIDFSLRSMGLGLDADDSYLRQDFYFEALGKGDPAHYRYTGEGVKLFSKRYSGLFSMWASVLTEAGQYLKKGIKPASYSFHILNTSFMLFFGEREDEAAQFLLRYFREIDHYEFCKPDVPILLARIVLAQTRLETANALYGLFSYEMDRVERDRFKVIDQSRRLLAFMRKARAYILEANECTLEDNRPWFDILFGNGELDRFLESCEKVLDAGEPLSSMAFKYLTRVVDAFSFPSGIHLGILGLPRFDDYDKLPNALAQELIHRGRAYLNQCEETRVYYGRIAQKEPLRNINLHLQNHLMRLQRSQVADQLSRVGELKKNLPQELTEAQQQELLDEIDKIAQHLAGLTQGGAMRQDVERYITELREDFEQQYLGGQVDLMQKLPEEVRIDVHNYLVTSNVVFRMMENQKDESMDYSAALISLTKALELVMMHIYTRMDVKPYEGMKQESWKYYFDDNGQPIKTQTLRPCIELLKGQARFAAWGGDQVLDLGMLGLFQDISLQVGVDEQGEPKLSHLRSGKKHIGSNMGTLQQALMYVCNNYRNRSAHTDMVTLMQVQECQRLLIDGQKLLWIMLAILKE